MLSRSLKIVAPEIFELYIEDINIKENQCLVKIEKGAICKADIRYYKGSRDKRILGLKYPMSLIHEVVGRIVKDKSGEYNIGDKVVLVPNLIEECNKKVCVHKVCEEYALGENYCCRAEFCSSNCDGFSKEMVALPKRNVIKIENDIDSNIAVFSELISVAIAIIRRLDAITNNYINICIWGDGILGYIISSLVKNIFNKNVVVVGKHEEKLKKFNCDRYITIEEIKDFNVDIVIECVGGIGMSFAINQILDVINPGGKIVLTGVSEKNIEIDTRKILEKGIIITGSTRSNIDDFKLAVDCFQNKEFVKSIEALVIDEIDIKDIADFYYAFEKTCESNILGKYIMNFNF